MDDEKTIRNYLSPAEYWEWRVTISELQIEKEKLSKAEVELKLLMKEAEMQAVRQQLFRLTRMEVAKQSVASAQAEYERFKGVLEEATGQSLNNKIIDDLTFEIKELPDSNQPLEESKE